MKLKQLLAAALMLVSAGAWAQTDVTSTYLDNADFSEGTLASPAITTYDYDMSTNNTTFCNLVALDGWTAVDNGNGKAGGPVAIGSGVWVGGSDYKAPATNSDGEVTGNVLGVVGCWSASAQYTQPLKAALPAGTYTIIVAAYNSKGGTNAINKNLIGFVEDGGTEHLAATTKYPVNTWKYEFITFTLSAETSGYVTLGYKSTGTGSANMPHLFLSGLEIYEGEVDAESYEAAKTAAREAKEAKVLWDYAKAAADAALANEEYAIVTGAEKVALEAEVAMAEPTTTEDYRTATTALTDATTAFTSAKSTYEMVAAAPTLAYADASKQPVVSSESTAATLIAALRAYYESHAKAKGVSAAVDYTSSITNANNPENNDGWTWTGNKNNPASNEPWTDADGTNTHSYFDGGNWNANSWTTTMKQTVTVPAGKYLLTAKGRAAVNTTLTMAVGEVSVDLPHVSASGNVFDRGWGDASLEFETDGRTGVEILVTASSSTIHEWFSVSDFRLVQLEDHTAAVAGDNLYAAYVAAQNALLAPSELLTNIAIENGQVLTELGGSIPNAYFAKGSEKTALETAAAAAFAVDYTNVEAMIAATEALDAATNAYLAAVPSYERAALVAGLAQFAKDVTGVGDQTALQIGAAMENELKLKEDGNTTNTAANIAEKANAQISFLMQQAKIYEGQVLGFDAEEYAPYTNAGGLQLAATAEAMGTNPENYTNEQFYIQGMAMANWSWTKNVTTMDAIYDGQFATTEANATSGNINLPGWTKVDGIRLLVKDEATDPGLAYTEGKAAVFSWGGTTLTYGEQTGYTLPLNKHSLYKLTFKIAAWRDGTWPSRVRVTLDGETQEEAITVPGMINDAEGNPFLSLTYFVEPTADNSVLSIYANQHFVLADLSLTEVPESEVTLAVSNAKWATFIAPFDVTVPEGVTAYTVDGVESDGETLTIAAVETIAANTPVVLFSEDAVTATVSGQAHANNATYTEGLLTGTYSDIDAPNGSYVLQSQEGKVGFYQVDETVATPKVKANRAYLTVPAGGEAKAFYFSAGADAIQSVFNGVAAGEAYDLGGRKVSSLQKGGIYVVGGKKVIVK